MASFGAYACRLGLRALWQLRAAGVAGGRSRGEWPATVVRGVWCQALSLLQQPLLWGGQPGFCGCGWCGRGDLAPAPQRRCAPWGWREGVPGGGAFRQCGGRLRSGAPPPPAAHPLGGLSGSTTHLLWAQVCGCGGSALSPWLARLVGAACLGGGGGLSPGGGLACHH